MLMDVRIQMTIVGLTFLFMSLLWLVL